jgi:hypothetical protein
MKFFTMRSAMPGVSYKVRRICAKPLRYVAYACSAIGEVAIHRDGRSLHDTKCAVKLYEAAGVAAVGRVAAILGGNHGSHPQN